MKPVPTVALEEHFAIQAVLDRTAGVPGPVTPAGLGKVAPALLDLGAARLAAMDVAGVDLAVLSHTAPGLEHVPGPDAVALAREANDVLLDAIARHPRRFAGFATLPTSDPAAAAEELRRTVGRGLVGALLNGSTDGRFLDHPAFDDLLGTAEDLGVPVYLHPGVPPRAVREAYYGGFSDEVGRMLSTSAWGWHAETAVHVLRLALGGVFDRHPGLQVVIGHLGEMLPVMIDRADTLLSPIAGRERSLREYLTGHVHVTVAGVYSVPAFQAAVQAFGIDRLLFATDHPYVPGEPARRFLDTVPLSPADRTRVAGGNAARLLRLAPAGPGESP